MGQGETCMMPSCSRGSVCDLTKVLPSLVSSYMYIYVRFEHKNQKSRCISERLYQRSIGKIAKPYDYADMCFILYLPLVLLPACNNFCHQNILPVSLDLQLITHMADVIFRVL
ncbi:hypothetical protein SAY87_022503 [Trapa incisa]|uniref:Uncharacterized protein n=1 Tax=Trapa incisa TaxID=236973 RepID=A0AAN7K4D7_9MYRT|nr:hypothetical protein SAY87_022503 [Trapa incisa]